MKGVSNHFPGKQRKWGRSERDFTRIRRDSSLGPFNTSNYVTSKPFFDKISTPELNEEKGTQETAGVDGARHGGVWKLTSSPLA